MALAVFFGASMMAQVSVTFQVDMSDQTVSGDGVHVAGDWQSEAGFAGDWDPATAQMTDDNSDGIYSLTVMLDTVGQFEYKFVNGANWDNPEDIPVINQKGGGNSNRVFIVNAWHADVANLPDGLILPAVMFSGSAPAGKVAVRLQVNMANQLPVSDLGVHVAGDFSDPVWTPQLAMMFSSTDAKYAYVATVDPDMTYAFKFLNGDFWGDDETVPAECVIADNRSVVVGADDVITDAVCFGACSGCAPPSQLLFRVDMSSQIVSPNGVHVAGNWQAAAGFDGDWNPGTSEMTDPDGDGIYELMIDAIDQGSYEFKFVNGNDWIGDNNFPEAVPGECSNGGGNRVVVVGADLSTAYYCFNQCSTDCPSNPDPASITFRVDMTAETIAAEGVFLIGNFTNPVWQTGAMAMYDVDADGIYEVTTEVSGSAEIQYKFVNGDVTVPANEEFQGNTEGLECNVPSGVANGWNRTHTRTGVDEVLPVVPFGACGEVNVSEIDLGGVSIYPNPTNGKSFISIENPNGFKLEMSIVDITGKTVRTNTLINSTRFELNTSDLNSGLYFLNIVNSQNDRAVYKLMVQ